MLKIDFSRAFRQLKVDPADFLLFCLHWKDAYYVDGSLRDLNIPISESKLTPPTTKIVCLGIQVDSESATLSIPVLKLEEILQACQSFVKLQNFTRKHLGEFDVCTQSCETCQVLCKQTFTHFTYYETGQGPYDRGYLQRY